MIKTKIGLFLKANRFLKATSGLTCNLQHLAYLPVYNPVTVKLMHRLIIIKLDIKAKQYMSWDF